MTLGMGDDGDELVRRAAQVQRDIIPAQDVEERGLPVKKGLELRIGLKTVRLGNQVLGREVISPTAINSENGSTGASKREAGSTRRI